MKVLDKAVYKSWEYWASLIPQSLGLFAGMWTFSRIDFSACYSLGQLLWGACGFGFAIGFVWLAAGWRDDLYRRLEAKIVKHNSGGYERNTI